MRNSQGDLGLELFGLTFTPYQMNHILITIGLKKYLTFTKLDFSLYGAFFCSLFNYDL